jgi:predicted deacylase
MESVNIRPDIIHIKFNGREADLVHYRLGQGERRVLILAGMHGREHGGVQVAYELLEQLAATTDLGRPLRGQVDILPVCNPMAYAAESRFTPHSERNMSVSFTPGPPRNLTETLSQAILDLAKGAEIVLSLHSAGLARYLPHVIFYRPQDAEWAASLGLPFAIKRNGIEAIPNRIAARLLPGQRMLTLELGGGIVVYPDDVALGIDLILALLGRSGFLGPGDWQREPTSPDLIYMHDARLLVCAPAEGAFYTRARLGEDFVAGETFGFWVPLDELRPQPTWTPQAGKLIYLRTRNRVPQGDTLAMFLPHQNGRKS